MTDLLPRVFDRVPILMFESHRTNPIKCSTEWSIS